MFRRRQLRAPFNTRPMALGVRVRECVKLAVAAPPAVQGGAGRGYRSITGCGPIRSGVAVVRLAPRTASPTDANSARTEAKLSGSTTMHGCAAFRARHGSLARSRLTTLVMLAPAKERAETGQAEAIPPMPSDRERRTWRRLRASAPRGTRHFFRSMPNNGSSTVRFQVPFQTAPRNCFWYARNPVNPGIRQWRKSCSDRPMKDDGALRKLVRFSTSSVPALHRDLRLRDRSTGPFSTWPAPSGNAPKLAVGTTIGNAKSQAWRSSVDAWCDRRARCRFAMVPEGVPRRRAVRRRHAKISGLPGSTTSSGSGAVSGRAMSEIGSRQGGRRVSRRQFEP